MTSLRLLSIAFLTCSSLACSGASEGGPSKDAPKAAEAPNEIADATPTKAADPSADSPTTPPAQEAPAQPTTPSAATVEVAPPKPVAVEPGTVPVAPVVATKASAPWREAATPGESITLTNLAGGVLGQGAGGHYVIDDDGQLVLREDIEDAGAELIGTWPKNVWFIESRSEMSAPGDRSDADEIIEYRLMRLRSNRRWVPQEYGGEQRFVATDEDFRMGGKGGLLVRSGDSVTRVAGAADDPELGMYKGNEIFEFAETRSGRLYTVSTDASVLYVQRDCADQACVDENALTLPFGIAWEFSAERSRQRHSMSMVASVTFGGDDKHHLLHYETGGWSLESLATEPSGLWPTKDGGLWAHVGAELWHRDPNGGWRNIELPEGASSLSVAMRADQSELWVSATVGGKAVVLATHANAQELPPEQPKIETQTG